MAIVTLLLSTANIALPLWGGSCLVCPFESFDGIPDIRNKIDNSFPYRPYW